jgi:hypothetical protein
MRDAAELVFAVVEGPSLYLLRSAASEWTILDSTPALAFATETPNVRRTMKLMRSQKPIETPTTDINASG